MTRAHIFVLEMLEELQFSVCSFGENWGAEGLHDLLDGNILVGELISCGAKGGESRVS